MSDDVVVVDTSPTTLIVEPIENNTTVSPFVTNVEVNQTTNAVVAETVVQNITITAPGPQGIPGPKGDSNVFYTHVQGLPASAWEITHDLNGYPTAVVFDSAGTQCEGTISYQSANQMTITFTSSFSGTAYVI